MLAEPSPQSPAQRLEQETQGDTAVAAKHLGRLGIVARVREIATRVIVGVWSDGFIHAGNLAYLALLTLFPFFIVMAALASLFGRSADTLMAVNSFLVTLPPTVADLLRKPIGDVLLQRTGSLLWLGAAVGLWTVGSFIETVRDIMRRAYGTTGSLPFWRYRLSAIGVVVGAVIVMMVAFTLQVLLTAAEQFVYRLVPYANDVVALIQLGRLVPLVVAWGALYLVMWTLTPRRYRLSNCPKWPGALFVALWWYASLALLPRVLEGLGGYDATYGSLAGVIIALFFFWIVGFGFVIGAHVNAALAENPTPELSEPDNAVRE